jgi:uncharacterized membrane protein
MEELIKTITCTIAGVIEGFSALLIAHGIIKAVLFYSKISLGGKNRIDQLNIRLELGKSLALSLEFLLAADILRTAVAPTWEDIGKLAAIAALRTLLNYFLDRELKHDHARGFIPTNNGSSVHSDTIFL